MTQPFIMRIFILALLLSFSVVSFAQKVYQKPPSQPSGIKVDRLNVEGLKQSGQISSDRLSGLNFKVQTQELFSKEPVRIVRSPESGLPIFIEGKMKTPLTVTTRSNQVENRVYSFLEQQKGVLKIGPSQESFKVVDTETDELGITHTTMHQYYQGMEVYGSEVMVHMEGEEVTLFNGRYYPIPAQEITPAQINAEAALRIAKEDLGARTKLIPFTPDLKEITGEDAISKNELKVYFSDFSGKEAHLVYHLQVAANPMQKWTYLIDAHDGSILKKFNRVCTLHPHLHREHSHDHGANIDWSQFKMPSPKSTSLLDGPATANATDLNGVTRQLNTYEIQGTYYLLDGSRNMWQGFSSDGSSFNGGIYTADGNNTNTDDFEPIDITSGSNQWASRAGVSGHYNAGLAYEYFRQTFGRNSINGSGGNVISFINVADDDGGGLDNAFWSGAAMFYGNGRDAFAPLAGSLDVAGHEMSHGVIQETANLEYQGESGALNESFADIFGVMIDRDDWRLGEDVVNSQIFRSGALRDMQNPNNGGSRLGDPGYQPDNVRDQFFGSEDNGGVHINSGIVNRAFYLFANTNGVGRDRAEQVYYRALDQYHTRSSQFIDSRLAVIRAANELYGNGVGNAAAAAFDAVGITDGTPTAPPQEAEVNPGNQLVYVVGAGGQGIFITDVEGNVLQGAGPLVNDAVLFKPSISDDGSNLAYINGNNQLRLIQIDWNAGRFEVLELSNEQVWRRVAISKDGLKLAATTTDLEASISVFDLRTGSGRAFELFNPTTAEGGINSGEVAYADGLEWDLSSQFVIYDAFNEVGGLFSDYTYFDIGSVEVWNNNIDDFGSGGIEKLFASLPDGISIGNPAISKNSPNILAFDYLDDEGNTAVFGVDVETGNNAVIAETNNLGFPNYSVEDDFLIHEDEDFFGDKVVKTIVLNDDKISANFEGVDFLSGAQWPNWFATGARTITSTQEALNPDGLGLETFPNPASQNLIVKTELKESGTVLFRIHDMLGKEVYRHQVKVGVGTHQSILPIDQLAKGTYLLKMQFEGNIVSKKIVKW